MKHTPHKTLSKWILGILLISGILLSGVFFAAVDPFSNNVRPLLWTWWVVHSFWQFFSNDGNPGELLFQAQPKESWMSGASLVVPDVGPAVLTWSFWSETVGWIQLQNIIMKLSPPEALGIWSLSGYAWNDQAGWIDFSGVTWHQANTAFSGYAWNDGIWWLDMAWASLQKTSAWLLWKVKVIGNLGWGSAYDTTYMLTNNASTVNASTYINVIRKNVALLTRNLPNSAKNITSNANNIFNTTRTINNIAVYTSNPNDNILRTVNYGFKIASVSIQDKFEDTSAPLDSIIVIGWDFYINDAVNELGRNNTVRPKSIIVLKDEQWRGWNIYIDGAITKVYATLVAEWSLYSGERISGNWSLYNDDPNNLLRIPNRQLHVYGTIISNNTIGWYYSDGTIVRASCPSLVDICSEADAIKYDFNRFRDYADKKPENRWYPTDAYDDFSFIIEYNPRILSDPPPWLATQN